MADFAPGTLIADRYRVESVIIVGPNATTYGCTVQGGGKFFIKVLKAILAKDREDMGRFQREYEVLSQLSHPCIAKVFEMGTAPDGAPFIAMEWLEGETLKKKLERGPLDPREA